MGQRDVLEPCQVTCPEQVSTEVIGKLKPQSDLKIWTVMLNLCRVHHWHWTSCCYIKKDSKLLLRPNGKECCKWLKMSLRAHGEGGAVWVSGICWSFSVLFTAAFKQTNGINEPLGASCCILNTSFRIHSSTDFLAPSCPSLNNHTQFHQVHSVILILWGFQVNDPFPNCF